MCVRVVGESEGVKAAEGYRVCAWKKGWGCGVHKAQAAAMQAQFRVSGDSQGRPASNAYSHAPSCQAKLPLAEPSPPSPQKQHTLPRPPYTHQCASPAGPCCS